MRRLPALAGLLALAVASPATAGGGHPHAVPGIDEPSGVTRHGDELLLVGDDDAHGYVSLPIAERTASGLVALAPARLLWHPLHAAGKATDLEGIDVLADGRVVVLSEDARSLFDEDGPVIRYGRDWSETDGRGLEGVAVLPDGTGGSRVAVLWEGGYLRPTPAATPAARRPRVLVHRLAAGARPGDLDAADVERVVELQVYEPLGKEPRAQRFRAPDLVWHRWRDETGRETEGWIVLLSSGWAEPPDKGSLEECTPDGDEAPRRWCHRWLQRFALDGSRHGDAFDLDAVLPAELHRSNWEGMGWYEPGRSLVLVYDEALAERVIDPQQAFVLDLPEGW